MVSSSGRGVVWLFALVPVLLEAKSLPHIWEEKLETCRTCFRRQGGALGKSVERREPAGVGGGSLTAGYLGCLRVVS